MTTSIDVVLAQLKRDMIVPLDIVLRGGPEAEAALRRASNAFALTIFIGIHRPHMLKGHSELEGCAKDVIGGMRSGHIPTPKWAKPSSTTDV